jgi:hypothetical protein
MPMTFPAHQGLILPVVRRWPHSFDALALSVGAAMPDLTDTVLGLSINGYFKQWYGHALIGMFTLDAAGGLLLTWFIATVARRLQASSTRTPSNRSLLGSSDAVAFLHTRLRVWSSSVFVGILSHIGFDLISHDTNLLLYPWLEDPHWFPGWWYQTWFEMYPLPMFGRSYSVGVFSVVWCLLTVIGIFFFIQFLAQEYVDWKGAQAERR